MAQVSNKEGTAIIHLSKVIFPLLIFLFFLTPNNAFAFMAAYGSEGIQRDFPTKRLQLERIQEEVIFP